MAQLHDVSDPRNASILINVNGKLTPRGEAMVSVFDSGFGIGDACRPDCDYLCQFTLRSLA